jgi:hypothetical protein
MAGRFLSLVAVFLLAAVPTHGAERVALVVGNGAYTRVPALPNPPRDALDISGALEHLGFTVTRLSNAGAADMRKALVEFGRAAEGSKIAMVFYAGHGMEVGGENWLIPIDAELRSDADVESEAVGLRSVNVQVSKARQLGLIILDACRNNPFEAKMRRSLATRAVARGLAPTEPTDNVLIAYAARDGTTAGDGDGKNSPFTTALLRHIETPGLEISFLFRRVRDDVMAATKREQQPFVYGSLSKEEIYLKEPEVTGPKVTNLSTAPSATSLASPKPDGGSNEKKENRSSETTVSNPAQFSSKDSERIAAIAAKQQLKLPEFAIAAAESGSAGTNSRFVGVWSNERGWGNGKGRHGMLIVTGVSATGLARGYWLWGPSTKGSWEQTPAGYSPFAESIEKDGFVLHFNNTISVKLDAKNVMRLVSSNSAHPAQTVAIDLHAVWQLAAPIASGDSPSSPRQTSKPPTSTQSNKRDAASPEIHRAAQPAANSQCDRMHDRLGCLCALQNGGGISVDGKSWWSKRRSSDPTNEAFVRCQMRAGRT